MPIIESLGMESTPVINHTDSSRYVDDALKSGQDIAKRHASILLRHYVPTAVSEKGLRMATRFEAQEDDAEARQFLLDLPPDAFIPYLQLLEKQSGWSREDLLHMIDRTAIVEVSRGCAYDCAMCYINAPKVNGYIPWPHMQEILGYLSSRQNATLREEAVHVLTNDALRGKFREPKTIFDVAISLARHRRNRFNNFSDHLMLYWRSNPTNWRDPLFEKHFGHIAKEVVNRFQLVHVPELAEAARADPEMQERFQQECAGDERKLRDAMTFHAIISTVPYARGSINDQAVQYMLDQGVASEQHFRVSAPHCNLMPSRKKHPERYWQDLTHTLQSANPKMVYLFCSNIAELEELAEHLSDAFEHSERPWWIEARLALYEIRTMRKRGSTEEEIFHHLQKHLKRLSFIGSAEGRAKDIQSPFFSRQGTVMCVNGAVLTADSIGLQACTTPSGEDRDEGEIFSSLHHLSAEDAESMLGQYPLVNRAREFATPNVEAIPLTRRRPQRNWFAKDVEELRTHADYEMMKDRMAILLKEAKPYLRLYDA